MRRWKSRFSGTVLCVLLCMISVPAAAEDSPLSRGTLKGLSGVYLVVEKFQPDMLKYKRQLQQFNLSGDAVMGRVENRLRKEGIRVLSRTQWQETPGRPVLYVNINTHESERYWFSYDIKLELRQVVFLERSPSVKAFATTWSQNLTGSANIGTLDRIGKGLDSLLDNFLAAVQ